MKNQLKQEKPRKLLSSFKHYFGEPRQLSLFQSPGRVNLLGEHTDYNQGFVLPAAVSLKTFLLASKRKDAVLLLRSLNLKGNCSLSLSETIKAGSPFWANYPKGVIKEMLSYKKSICGMHGLYFSEIPLGCGMSSSAAMEVVTAVCLAALNKIQIPKSALALLCQRAENSFVGVPCGIMDQFACALAKQGHTLFLDCKTRKWSHVPFQNNTVKVVVCNSMVSRKLAVSEYSVRKKQCEEAVKLIREKYPPVKSLRDVTPQMLLKIARSLPPVLRRRAHHVVSENNRVLKGVQYLKRRRLKDFGNLFFESHKSLQQDYDVSCPELDALVESAKKINGVLGSRMTGAGFGGCTVNLVRAKAVDEFRKRITVDYRKKTGMTTQVFVCSTVGGASEVKS